MSERFFTAMLDCSRNGVLNLDSVKRMIDLLPRLGYQGLMLYTEDTYEVDDEPYFGHLRGRYSKAELKEIVAYGDAHGVEVIPCIQVLAHLNQIFLWPEYAPVKDAGDVLMVGASRTHRLLENIFKTLRECFTSKRIHMGMDETHLLGLGRYLQEHGYRDRQGIFLEHLRYCIDLAKRYGFEPLIWSDMFFRYASGGEYYEPNAVFSKELLNSIPKEVTPVYWDYYHDKQSFYEGMIDRHREINKDVWFAGGVWTWAGFVPAYPVAFGVSLPAMRAVREKDVKNIIMTAWGDNGAETSPFLALPSLFYARKVADGVEDLPTIKKEFQEIVGASFDAFLLLGEINETTYVDAKKNPLHNPSKYLLYNDPLIGMLNNKISLEDDARFQELSVKIRAARDQMGPYAYINDAIADLTKLLSLKQSLPLRIHEAYERGDRDALRELLPRIDLSLVALDRFLLSFRKAWLKDRKPQGFDIQELRLGGLSARLQEAKMRIEEYLNGSISRIEELEEAILPYDPSDAGPEAACYNLYLDLVSPNLK